MGMFDVFRKKNEDGDSGAFNFSGLRNSVLNQSVEDLYRSQPHLRTAVSFLARNVAQVKIHTYKRVSDTDRQRVHGIAITKLLANPNPQQSYYEFMVNVISDYELYDEALIQLAVDPKTGDWQMWVIPPSWIQKRRGDLFRTTSLLIRNSDGVETEVREGTFIHIHGYNPAKPSWGSSPVDAAKQILAEQIHSWTYRNQRWINGGRMGTVISRPAGAPLLSEKARKRRNLAYKAAFANNGSEAGGTLVLEDGETMERIGFSAREDQWVEVTKLSLQTIASLYHINPTMLGLNEEANYSNVEAFAKMLYTETLGPRFEHIAGVFNSKLLPLVEPNAKDLYLEFNIVSKLRGSFDEQAAVMQKLVLSGIITPAEARSSLNMPDLGDETHRLLQPLNVVAIDPDASEEEAA